MQILNESLLNAPEDFAIVQCISADCAMGITPSGKEIPCLALTIRKKYPEMVEMCEFFNPGVGDVIRYRGSDGRVIYNLVTKEFYYEKPIYGSLDFTLRKLIRMVLDSGNLNLAIPKLGSGLDQLYWGRVFCMIESIFYGSGVNFLLCVPDSRGRK